jgi:hypothetical protein
MNEEGKDILVHSKGEEEWVLPCGAWKSILILFREKNKNIQNGEISSINQLSFSF